MNVSSSKPLVSIGIPAYCRSGFLHEAIESLVRQSYQNLEIIVSDDRGLPSCKIKNIVMKFATDDPRIRYYRQEVTTGMMPNFRFVLEKARGDYFMWAAEDDKWEPTFVEAGVRILSQNVNYHAWFPQMDNIDSFGHVIRLLPKYSRFTATSDKRSDVLKFVLEPEILGKANMMYGIFRMDALKKTVNDYFFPENCWGPDHCFMLAFLTRFNFICTEEVLFHKRVANSNDDKDNPVLIVVHNPARHIFPFKKSRKYIYESYKAVRKTPYRNMVLCVMLWRLVISFRNYILSKLEKMVKKD